MITRLLPVLGLLGTAFLATPASSQETRPATSKPAAKEKAGEQGSSPEPDATGGESGSEEGGSEKPQEAGEAPDAAEGAEQSGERESADEDAALVADAEKGGSPVEDPGRTYKFVGARYRVIVVPAFMMRLFGDGGTTVAAHSFGAEFALRKDAFEYNFGLWYASYAMDPTAFKAKDDGEDAWEMVESGIKVLYLTADFLWSHEFTPEIALNYGMGAGFGFVFGPLYRNQAYRQLDGSYARCTAAGSPNSTYCNSDNNHYNNYEEPDWTNGGSKPIIFPWLALQTGVRYKPHRNFAARFDAGFGLSGFFFGIGADYGL